MNKSTQAERILAVLRQRYPHPKPHLNAASPWQLLAATMLSAQCTDARVNAVTPALFARWPGPEETAHAALAELEEAIRSTGFFRMKARSILQSAQRIMAVYGGAVPRSLAELVTLPGVARKTANVVLWGAFGINEGLAVDTHVARISSRLGLTGAQDADKIEQELLVLFPCAEWGDINHRMVSFGRDVCRARAPRCEQCELLAACPRRGVEKSRKIRYTA
ncbi:MAG: endonuclease III [Desulfovibrionaceae bacterium]|nr:endonuclease III [Desulfovibrionaceae bacterium]